MQSGVPLFLILHHTSGQHNNLYIKGVWSRTLVFQPWNPGAWRLSKHSQHEILQTHLTLMVDFCSKQHLFMRMSLLTHEILKDYTILIGFPWYSGVGVQYLSIFVRKHSFFVPGWTSTTGTPGMVAPTGMATFDRSLEAETKQTSYGDMLYIYLEHKLIHVSVRAYGVNASVASVYNNKWNNIECMYLEPKKDLFWGGSTPKTKDKNRFQVYRYIVDIWYEIDTN